MKGALGLLVLVIAGILGYEVISGHAADLINAFRTAPASTVSNSSQTGPGPTTKNRRVF